MLRKKLSISLLLVLGLSTTTFALEFAPLGARAQGMGGAFVATASDASAVYWNPAGLSAFPGWEAQVLTGVHGQDHMGMRDTFDEIDDIMNGQDLATVAADPERRGSLSDLLRDVAAQDAGVDLNAAAGVLVKGHYGSHAFAISALPLVQGGGNIVVDTTHLDATLADNTSTVALSGIQGRQYGLSYGRAFFGKRVFVGTNLKLIDAYTYYDDLTLLDPDVGIKWSDLRRNAKHSQGFSTDLGLMVMPVRWCRLGVVGRDLNSPSFKSGRGGDITLRRQVRAGAALSPLSLFTVALDLDLTENDSFTQGYKERNLALGLEKGFLMDVLTLRAGGYKNLADSGSHYVATAGLGLRVFFACLDIGAGYDFHQREALGSLSLAGRF
ncbi:MAG: conjugal transfer protein TraF [Pseudomonadota bacterium]